MIASLLAIGSIGGTAIAQSPAPPAADCRQQIAALCGANGDRTALRTCLRASAGDLSATCRTALVERVRDTRNDRRRSAADIMLVPAGAREIAYGADALQRLDYWPAPASAINAPLVVFIHGGGWTRGDRRTGTGTKPAFYNGLGAAFASLNYRLVPGVTPADQAADIAVAIARLRSDAAALGHDPDRIIVMGHSAGAHLAALVATDTAILARAGVPAAALRGVVLLDGAGYDVERQMAGARGLAAAIYRPAFTDDVARQRALSPITHIGGVDARNWLILHVDRRARSRDQSQGLAAALAANGASATATAVPDSTHGSVNRDAGAADSFVGRAIARFVTEVTS